MWKAATMGILFPGWLSVVVEDALMILRSIEEDAVFKVVWKQWRVLAF